MTGMDDLVTWLRAALDLAEQHARKDLAVLDASSNAGDWRGHYGHNLPYSEIWDDVGILFRIETPRHQADVMAAARMVKLARQRALDTLAEVDAKRRILDLVAMTEFDLSEPDQRAHHTDLRAVLRLLALPLADRPGYRDEWRP